MAIIAMKSLRIVTIVVAVVDVDVNVVELFERCLTLLLSLPGLFEWRLSVRKAKRTRERMRREARVRPGDDPRVKKPICKIEKKKKKKEKKKKEKRKEKKDKNGNGKEGSKEMKMKMKKK